MFFTDLALDLVRAVLVDNCSSEEFARRHLANAAKRGIDPLDYCAHDFGLGNELVWRRAAEWAGYPFAARLPSHPSLPSRPIDRLDRLGEARTLRLDVLGKSVTFVAPHFAQVLQLKRNRVGSVRFAPPDAIEAGIARAAREQLIEMAQHRMTRRWPHASAAVSLDLPTRLAFVGVFVGLVVLAALSGSLARPWLIPIASGLLVGNGLLRLFAAWPRREPAEPAPLAEAALPTYTVLVPLRDEAQMVPALHRALCALDYPSHKLDIKYVVESKSPATVAAVDRVLGDPRFRAVVVPEGGPATKPKAIDYALPLARGDLIVVYDAEDVPDPTQLRRAAARFAADRRLACLQAELVPENGHENILTMLFSGEYAGLFGQFLPALAAWGLPVPLGGTSNHFRAAVLRGIGGWDAFNVTEDADLGVRLARRGMRVGVLASRTLEEAPLSISAWMRQRRRWMKGWMQTFIVHNRSPHRLLRDLGLRAFIGFQLLVGGMILSSLLHTLFVAALALRVAVEGVEGLSPRDAWDWLSIGILGIGYGGAYALVVSGLVRQRAWRLIPAQIALPFYWILHTLATLQAAHELIVRPVHWAKTAHGVTRLVRQPAAGGGRAALRPRIG